MGSGTLDFTSINQFLFRAQTMSEEAAWMFSFSQEEIREEVIRLNQEQLYEDGIRSDGSDLGPYRPFTIEVKRRKGQRYDHVTLHDEGDFYRSFYVEFGEDWFEVMADDHSKYDRPLLEVYGENVLGLTRYNMERLRALLLKYYAEFIRTELFR